MSHTTDEEKVQQSETDASHAMRRRSSTSLQEIVRSEGNGIADENPFVRYKRKIESSMAHQQSYIKQFSHALSVCEERGVHGSTEHLEAEKFLLIACECIFISRIILRASDTEAGAFRFSLDNASHTDLFLIQLCAMLPPKPS